LIVVIKYHTTLPAQQIDDALRRSGLCVVRIPDTIIEFEITHRGVEVVAENMRYVMYQERDFCRDMLEFTVDGRWECRAWQEGFDGLSHFEVIDKAGDPFRIHDATEYNTKYAAMLTPPANERRKKLILLCL
jgi:hypothetical protein